METGRERIGVLIPCYNEELTVGKVIDDFRRELPEAEIVVYDNRSTDRTSQIALERGARVVYEPRGGKGYVIESMFNNSDYDIIVMADGDDTYPADKVHDLLQPIRDNKAHMTVGARLSDYQNESFRSLHVMGNNLVRTLVNWVGQGELTDILSGYRAISRHVLERLPIVSQGFEVETEMTLQMLYYHLHIVEVPIPYGVRPEGSTSKLNTFRDGFRVLYTLFNLFRSIKPLTFFGSLGLLLFFLGLVAGYFPVSEYFLNADHYITHVPLAILASGLVLASVGFVFLGIVLHAVNWRFRELHNVLTRTHYLGIKSRDTKMEETGLS